MRHTGKFPRLHKKINYKSENNFVSFLQLTCEREENLSTADV